MGTFDTKHCVKVATNTGVWLFRVGLLSGCQQPDSLHQYIRHANTFDALQMIERGGAVDRPDEDGFTPLIYAAKADDGAVAEALVAKGARVNYMSPSGASPLAAAAFRGSDRVVDLLLKHGADPNISSRRVFSPLHAAASMGHQHIAQRLIDAGAHVNAVSGFNTTPLQQAAGAGETELMALLLDRGAEVNYQPPGGGDTALLSAALNSNSTAVELLLKRHADLERTNRFGGTALMAAASWGHTAICSDLLRAGAKLDVTNRAGDNALALAIKRYNFETAGVLIVAGATVEPQTNSPEAVFHGAVYRKLLADKHAADGRNAEARADYTAAHASFTAVREQFANATQSKEADTMKASATAERKAFWGNLAEGAARAAVQGAIQGLVVGSANAAARHSNLDTEYFVISSSQPAGSSGHLTGFGAGDAAQARQYESEADRLRENVKLCDQFIQEIQNKLNP